MSDVAFSRVAPIVPVLDLDGRFSQPLDTPYGLREFAYVDPDGTQHRIGSPLAY